MKTLVLALVLAGCGPRRSPPPPAPPDPDGDRITGAADLCPNDPEPYNGIDDTDGCPDKPRARTDCVWVDVLEILDRIYFATGASLAERVAPILDAVAATIAGNPQIDRIGVVGGRAPDEPAGVAAERAATVAQALVARGVPAARIETHAYAKPISSDVEKSRAVWFVVLRMDGEDRRPATGDARWTPWDRDCPAKWKAHRETGAVIDCDCLDARPPE